jgi:hypothetical protein
VVSCVTASSGFLLCDLSTSNQQSESAFGIYFASFLFWLENKKERAMQEELSSDIIVDVIEATIRVLIGTGLTRDDALQVMLGQIAAQVSPDVMKIATQINEKYFQDFEKAMWCFDEVTTDEPVKSAEFAFGPL